MKNGKKTVKFFVIIIVAIIFCEVFGFNYAYFASRIDSPQQENIASGYSPSMKQADDGYYISDSADDAYAVIDNLNKNVKYIYVDPWFTDSKDYQSLSEKEKSDLLNNPYSALKMSVWCIDEGNKNWYKLGTQEIYRYDEESKYIRLHPYGKVKALKFTFFDNDASNQIGDFTKFQTPDGPQYLIKINSFVCNARVPFFMSKKRMAFAFLAAAVLYVFFAFFYKPGSPLLRELDFSDKKQKRIIACFAGLVILVLALFPFTRREYVSYDNFPPLSQHRQYYLLAQALAQGHFNLDISPASAEKLSKLSNPYDTVERYRTMRMGYDYPWDTAFYNGKFYCYFGIVPCLIFYLPYYLILKKPFPTVAGISISLAVFILLSFLLIKYTIKKWFKNISLDEYLFITLLFIVSSGALYVEYQPIFYNLPIICALDFTLGGLLLWLKSADKFKEKKKGSGAVCLIFGSLCMALVAGCRPQLLLASFLCIPIFAPLLFKKNSGAGRKILNLILFAAPYAAVAAGLMYYNYARFGSPFDFGANYNLTTNDMTHRGFYFGRIAEGIFIQLFQLPSISYRYPFIEKVNFNSHYMGTTVKDGTVCGLFMAFPSLWFAFLLPKVKGVFKKKKLFAPCVMMMISAAVILIADIEMAGLVVRYWMDYAVFIGFVSSLVLLQFLQNKKRKLYLHNSFKNTQDRSYIYRFLKKLGHKWN